MQRERKVSVNHKRFGSLNGNSKLDMYKVVTIRYFRKHCGYTLVKLAKLWGVSVSNVSSIVNRKTWKHI